MSRFEELWEGYLTERLSQSEVEEFFVLLRENEGFMQASIDHLLSGQTYTGLSQKDREEIIFQQVLARCRQEKQPARVIQWRWMAVAAAVILVLAVSVFILVNQKESTELAETPEQKQQFADVAPGGDKAILTLADGRQIILDTAGKGALTQQGGILVINQDGQLTYQQENDAKQVFYNTISTPRGGQYQLVLADGTKVWLNAASSLRFPTAFPGDERAVELTGEGYFEVAHDPSKPFHVKVSKMEVQVLGTHFNINGYSDEPAIKTTLLEGRVKVTKNERHVFLNPGQQAIAKVENSNIHISNNVDLEEVLAWKNGAFNFENMSFDEVMRQLSRWYNLTVVYQNGVPEFEIGGKMGRDVHLSKILEFFKKAGIKYKLDVETRKLTIINK